MAIATALVRASTFFTIDADIEITEGETLVIAGKTYTFNATLGSGNGAVHLSGGHQGCIQNVVAAINLSNEGESAVGAGTDYAVATTRNESVHAVEGTDTLTINALVPGAIGNHIPCTIGTSAATLDNATLQGGEGNIGTFFDDLFRLNQINSEVQQELKKITPRAD